MTDTFDYGATCSPDCPLCHGRAYVNVTDPAYPGYVFLQNCPNKDTHRWTRDIGISLEEAQGLDWRKFATRKSSTQIKRSLSLLVQRGYGLLYLWGNPGVGKTALSKSATIMAKYKYGIPAFYTSQAGMTDKLRASYDENAGQIAYKRTLDWFSSVGWLVLDEIGRDRSNEFSKNVFSEVLNARYVASIERKTNVTVLISNFAPNDVLDDYQLDRVNDKRSTILHVQDISFRALPLWEEPQQEIDKTWWQNL